MGMNGSWCILLMLILGGKAFLCKVTCWAIPMLVIQKEEKGFFYILRGTSCPIHPAETPEAYLASSIALDKAKSLSSQTHNWPLSYWVGVDGVNLQHISSQGSCRVFPEGDMYLWFILTLTVFCHNSVFTIHLQDLSQLRAVSCQEALLSVTLSWLNALILIVDFLIYSFSVTLHPFTEGQEFNKKHLTIHISGSTIVKWEVLLVRYHNDIRTGSWVFTGWRCKSKSSRISFTRISNTMY